MSVDCWSSLRQAQDVESLPLVRGVYREFASLRRHPSGVLSALPLPARLLIHGKATFRRTFPHGDDAGFALQPIETVLFDSRLNKDIDTAWCSLEKNPGAAATVCVLATVDAPGNFSERHNITWLVNPGGITFDIHMAWLTAIPLDSLAHQEA